MARKQKEKQKEIQNTQSRIKVIIIDHDLVGQGTITFEIHEWGKKPVVAKKSGISKVDLIDKIERSIYSTGNDVEIIDKTKDRETYKRDDKDIKDAFNSGNETRKKQGLPKI